MHTVEEKPLITVLMPTYNVEKYVSEAVQSILDQTYTNIEFVIVDDGSTDKTYEILKEFAGKDNRIKLYQNDKNRKICYTLNKGLELSSGKYILRMDGDDISTPNRLEILYDYLATHPDVDLVGSNIIGINENGEQIGRQFFLHSDKYIRKCQKYKTGVSHIWLTKSEVYDTLHGYRNVPSCEDYDFLLRCNILGFKLANVNDFVYLNRIREGNTATSVGLIQIMRVKYIQKLHKQELRTGIRELNENEMKTATECSEKEQKKYYKGIRYLDLAIMNKKNIAKCVCNLAMAATSSKYVTRYLAIAFVYRVLLIEERIAEKLHGVRV